MRQYSISVNHAAMIWMATTNAGLDANVRVTAKADYLLSSLAPAEPQVILIYLNNIFMQGISFPVLNAKTHGMEDKPMKGNKRMIRTIAIAAASLTIIGTAVAIDSGMTSDVSMHRSWGYHVSPDGSGTYTPAAPPTTMQIQPVRTNVHSGGRLHGSANKRVGCGGCKGHPASNTIVGGLWGIQPLMTDGFRRNRGTRPHHPRATCRCN